jgi:hypothetical protein
MSELEELRTENARLLEELKRLYGVERPFICGSTKDIDDFDGMPKHILVCPAYGADGFALYKKIKPYSAPGY